MQIEIEELKSKRDIIAVEVGVFKGNGARQMLKLFDIKKLYLVDPYDKDKDFPDSKLLPEAPNFTVEKWKDSKKILPFLNN